MSTLNISLAATDPHPGDTILWESFEAAGWSALESFYKLPIPVHCERPDHAAWKNRKCELLQLACMRFTKAISFAGASPVRQGQSLIGLVWVEYHQLLQNNSPDPTITYASRVSALLAKCKDAKGKLESTDLDADEQLYPAKAYHLLGVLELESCQGQEADEQLKIAEEKYKGLGQSERQFEVTHLRGKLKQCKQDFTGSLAFFRQAEKSSEVERRARAFLARVTTLNWLGQTREAWQNFTVWRRLKDELDTVAHANLILRGSMLFGLIATRYGDLAEAGEIFAQIDDSLRCRTDVTDFCLAVYSLIRAEQCLESGDVIAMEKWLGGIKRTDPVPRGGFDCFEVLYLGSSCRQCVSECWTCETWCCDACGCCTPQLIVFHADTKLVPIDVQRIIELMVKGLRGRANYASGDLAKAESELSSVVRELPTIFPADSTANLPYKVALLKVLQARDNDGARIQACSNEILRQLSALNGKRNAFSSDVERVLGLWRSELSEDEVALRILQESLHKSLSARHPKHPDVLALQCEIIQVWAQLPSSDLCPLSAKLSEIVVKLSEVVDCLDYRRLAALRTAAWITLLGHHYSHAGHCFTRLEQMWLDLQERNHAAIHAGDSRVILGRVASEIECGTPMREVTEELHRGIQHIAANSDLSSLAHDLNRIGLILLRHKCFQSAYFFVQKSLDQYESLGDQVNCSTVRQSLGTIKQQALAACVELEEL